MLAHAILVATIYWIEGNVGDGKIWQMQHMDIFGGIKFAKLVKPAHTHQHVCTPLYNTVKYLELHIVIYGRKV